MPRRSEQERIGILESFALSQGVSIKTELPEFLWNLPTCTTYFFIDRESPAYIYIPPHDLRSKYIIPFLAHELGHHLIMLKKGLYQEYTSIIQDEKSAWREGEYLLRSLGLWNRTLEKKYYIAQKHCLGSYKGIPMLDEKLW